MAANTDASVATSWDDPSTCPFCGAALSDPGAGFVDHLDESAACTTEFETWREHVAGDIGGEWTG
jgi:hypothetical protein